MKLIFDLGHTMSLIIWKEHTGRFYNADFFTTVELFARSIGLVPQGNMSDAFSHLLPIENDTKFCTTSQLEGLISSIKYNGLNRL